MAIEAEAGVRAGLDELGQIAVTVCDLARCVEFYRDVLGLRFLFEAGTMAFFQCGSIRLMLGTGETSGTRGGTILYFKVEEINGTYELLRQAGVTFLQPPHLVAKMPDHDLWMAFLSDPEENTLGLMCEVRHGAGTEERL